MTFLNRAYFGKKGVRAALETSWEGEVFGTGLCAQAARMHPEHAGMLWAIGRMQRANAEELEPVCRRHGVDVGSEHAAKMLRQGAWLARHLDGDLKRLGRISIVETAEAAPLFDELREVPELAGIADRLHEHDGAMREWIRAYLEGKPGGGERVFEFLKSRGITEEQARRPFELPAELSDERAVVIAYFASEAAADTAEDAIRLWAAVREDVADLDEIGVLAKDALGRVREHKLCRTPGGEEPGIGRILGLVAAVPPGGFSLLEADARGNALGRFFHRGLRMEENDIARIADRLESGQAALGLLAFEYEASAAARMLAEMGATVESYELTPEAWSFALAAEKSLARA